MLSTNQKDSLATSKELELIKVLARVRRGLKCQEVKQVSISTVLASVTFMTARAIHYLRTKSIHLGFLGTRWISYTSTKLWWKRMIMNLVLIHTVVHNSLQRLGNFSHSDQETICSSYILRNSPSCQALQTTFHMWTWLANTSPSQEWKINRWMSSRKPMIDSE